MGKVRGSQKMNQFYNTYGEIFYISTVNIKMTELYTPFLKDLPDGARILDAGCGSGRDAFEFKKMGYEVEAMDASDKMVFLSTHLLEQKVYHMTFQEMVFEEPFDGIWACASLLHVPTQEMGVVLKNISNSLKPSGILFATFKYGDFEGERHERYFNDFNESKFTALNCGQFGLKCLTMWKTEDAREERAGEWWLNVLLSKQPEN